MERLAFLTVTALGLAACAGTAPAPNTAQDVIGANSDIDAVEFSRLDRNNDGVLNPFERDLISDEDIPGVIGEVDVDDE